MIRMRALWSSLAAAGLTVTLAACAAPSSQTNLAPTSLDAGGLLIQLPASGPAIGTAPVGLRVHQSTYRLSAPLDAAPASATSASSYALMGCGDK